MTEAAYERAKEIEKQIKYIQEALYLINCPYDGSGSEHRPGGVWIGECRDRTTIYTGWFDTKDDEFYTLITEWLKKRIEDLKIEFENL